ncbi:hypothetical protein pCPXV0250 [Cowpox virus]|uniref:Uncharacterized protein n=1 Tax=Cowpox virus TaxID=10243 RepID=A0A212PSX2_COWPX|nr:hypothetical protein pCPXV0250 [Cowpox virus]SNB49809.1 hypothetical protein pCPXV0250 [Cowpox virus]SNB49995.1 hypothetical protein pCPXV0250 [Cowpox virus]SNB53239.1 hypothetical protein pCPXV0250 [Cowpox virus]SNB56236.1 hypothetical protein pCPXV0250 [Cowpox virus]
MIERILFPTMSGTSRSPPSYLFIRKNVIPDIVPIIKKPIYVRYCRNCFSQLLKNDGSDL